MCGAASAEKSIQFFSILFYALQTRGGAAASSDLPPRPSLDEMHHEMHEDDHVMHHETHEEDHVTHEEDHVIHHQMHEEDHVMHEEDRIE